MKTRSTQLYCMMLTAVACLIAFQSMSQLPVEIDPKPKTAYYIDVMKAEKEQIFEIQEGLLHIQYTDKVGQWKQIGLQIFNWKLELVGSFTLDKSFGLNNYAIDLSKKLATIEMGKVYSCSLTDESGNRYAWNVRPIEPVKSKDLAVNIIIKPRHLSCSDESGNLVEFHGDIKLGKAPYNVKWYVMNSGKTDFLYQPREDIVSLAGNTAIIQVDKSPAYYVMMDVTDACGTNAIKMVFLDCQVNKKKINTIFVDPTQNLMKNTVKSIN
jgi:hypothetical protein